MGIPYCIVLNDGTTKNGILGLRNRNTTLKVRIDIHSLISHASVFKINPFFLVHLGTTSYFSRVKELGKLRIWLLNMGFKMGCV